MVIYLLSNLLSYKKVFLRKYQHFKKHDKKHRGFLFFNSIINIDRKCGIILKWKYGHFDWDKDKIL